MSPDEAAVTRVEHWQQPRYVADDSPDAEPPFVTKSGRVLTDQDIDTLVEEAERGYDIG